jgi:glycosyltransferase involved in cell wall biosynthesis
MRVAIDLFIADKEPGGMLYATQALISGLAQIDRTNEYIIITARPEAHQALAATANIHIHPVRVRSWRGMLIQHQLLLPDVLRRLRPDVLHVPAFAAPIGWNGPLVLTVHDLAFLKVRHQSSAYGRLYWQYLLRESTRRAQRIIAISEQTRHELTSFWSIPSERIRVIHNALRPSLQHVPVSSEQIQMMQQRYGGDYLLHVGRIVPRKNVELLIQAFDLLAPRFPGLHLVLTGGAGYGSEPVLHQIAASLYRERIHLAGWVTDEQLALLYAGARALVFPSRHEGFGLPIVEAMAYGTPVVASPEAASREVAGEAVVRADCSSAPPLAQAIAAVLTDEALRARLIQQGRAQAQMFTSEACAAATLRVYQEALGIEAPIASAEASDIFGAMPPQIGMRLPISQPE